MAGRKHEKMSSFLLRMSFIVLLSVIAIGGLIFAFTYGPLTPNKSRASNADLIKVDPQTGEYYDMQITSYIETSTIPQGGLLYKAKTRFELGGERVLGYRQLYGFLQEEKGYLDRPYITFEYQGASYPQFKSQDANLSYAQCIDLHSSTTPTQENYVATFCYRNTEISPGSTTRIYSPAANPFVETNYVGKKQTMAQILTTAFNKYQNPAPYTGLPVRRTRVHYFTIDPLNSTPTDFKDATYIMQGLTHDLNNEQYDLLCTIGTDYPKKYLKQSFVVNPFQGGSKEEITERGPGGCSFSYAYSSFKPFFISLDMEGGVPLPKPSPTATGPVPTILVSEPPKKPTPYPTKATPPPTKLPTRGPTSGPLPVAPAISNTTLPTAVQGRKYSTTITATDTNLDEKISVKIAGLPAGISQGSCVTGKSYNQISTTCQISGTTSKAGSVKITVTATDSRGLSTSKALILPIKSIRNISF